MYKKKLNDGRFNCLFILIFLFLVLLTNSSCIMVVPVPPDLKSFRRVIPKEAMKSLKQGISSREDLLLLLGSPDQRREQDRYFIYEWAFSLAFVAVGVPYAADGDVVNQYNFFCVEFDKDNRIKRHAHIKGDGIKAQYEVDEWMSESY